MHETKPTPEDYRAADELLERLGTIPDEHREVMRDIFAMRHARFGGHKFRVFSGLTPPSNPEEQAASDLFARRISPQEYEDKMRLLVSRPVDVRMLAEHLAYVESQLFAYGEFLQAIIRCSRAWEHGVSRLRDDEQALADIIPRMNAGPPLYAEQMANLRLFLEEVRVRKALGEALHKQHTAETASMLARMAVDECVCLWQHCCDMERYRPGRSELASMVTASRRFVRDHLPGLPLPKVLFAMVRYEHAAAREVLHDQAAAQVATERTYEKVVVNAKSAEVKTDAVVVRTGAPDNVTVSPTAANVFQRRGDAWAVRFAGGQENVLRDSRGAAYLHILLSRPDSDIPALELARLVNKNDGDCAHGEPEDVIDSEAMMNYRASYLRLQEELELAKAHGGSGRAEEILTEMQFLGEEISKSEGLGGRVRKEPDPAERARKAVGMAIARAIKEIAKFDERLAAHLNGPSLRQGLSLRYSPERGASWEA